MKSLLLLLLLATGGVLAGCLGDTVDGADVKPRLIYPPGAVFYRSVTNTTDLEIRWNRSPSDTQQNFKGYFLQLFTSSTKDTSSTVTEDTLLIAEIDSVHTNNTDTLYTFHNIPPGRYTVRAWGERYPDPLKPDSVVLSQSYQFVSFFNDPLPVSAPTAIYASSGASNNVNIFFTRSTSESHTGFLGYIVRYVDTTNTFSPKLIIATNIQRAVVGNLIRLQVLVPGNLTPPTAKPYKFWVKALRKDSIESLDSIGISWSSAERLPIAGINQNEFKIDTAVFIGQVGTVYNMATFDPSNKSAMFKIQYDGTNVSFLGLNGTTFASQIDTVSGLDFGYFSRPFTDAELQQNTSVTLPNVSQNSGAQVYALLPGGARARIHISATTTGYIQAGNNLILNVSFQPKGLTTPIPYF